MKHHYKYIFRAVTLLVLLMCAINAEAEIFVRGIVRDSVTRAGLPYASLKFLPSGKATLTDGKGIFDLAIPDKTNKITITCQGYATKSIPLVRNSFDMYDIVMEPQAQELKEFVVKKKRYSKKNNPAVDFAKRIRELRDVNNPRKHDWYTYDAYERISLSLDNFDTTMANSWVRHMPELVSHVDTNRLTGAPVLNLSLKEKATTEYWKRDGARKLSRLRGLRSDGIDDFLDAQNMEEVLSNLLREVDLYQSDINLLSNTFVSPLAPTAPDFYRFYLVDSAAVIPGYPDKHIALAFYPRNKAYLGFSGHIYVPLGDTTMFIRRVDLRIPRQSNINFIKDMEISQTFDRAPDGTRLKTKDDLRMILHIIEGSPRLYVTRDINTDNHSFVKPADADSLLNAGAIARTDKGAYKRDSTFWAEAAIGRKNKPDQKLDELIERLRKKSFFFWGQKVLAALIDGYIRIGRNSKFDVGPVTSFASYNDLEGLRLRAGGMTTANLSPHWFAAGYVAHGFGDHKWKYQIEGEYSFNEKRYHPREFPVHSLRLQHRYDVDRIGSNYLGAMPDNFVLSLSRKHDTRLAYLRTTDLTYTLEMANHFSIEATATQQRQIASKFVPYILADGSPMGHYNETLFTVTLRYAPGERFYQKKSSRQQVNPDAFIIALTHRFAPKGLFGSRYMVNRTELSLSKQFRLSYVGALDIKLYGGHVWGTAPFPELLIPTANLSYTMQPRSFALMNPLEFINTSYVSWFATWTLRGALLNLIPGVRRLGLREIITFNGVYGRRSSRVTPTVENGLPLFPTDITLNELKHRPYMEASIGLDNILKLFRVDYVWRLNYRHVPYPIDRSGIRFALHITF